MFFIQIFTFEKSKNSNKIKWNCDQLLLLIEKINEKSCAKLISPTISKFKYIDIFLTSNLKNNLIQYHFLVHIIVPHQHLLPHDISIFTAGQSARMGRMFKSRQGQKVFD